jgi:mycoketide-CoA synthase
MSVTREQLEDALRAALEERETLRGLIAEGRAPVAIIGMGCRYPGGVRSASDLWELVAAGRDAIGEFPADRGWDLEGLYDADRARPGTSYCRHGGFLHDAAWFDNEFYGISRREALAMDPQHRLLLEVCWEALERARIAPTSLRGTSTAVYAGIMYGEYGGTSGPIDPQAEGYFATGVGASLAAGRTAYVLGLEGAALSVDSACSSSLAALHLAGQALRTGECSLALAAGSTVLATPRTFTEFARQRGLSEDGRCKSFAEAADGVGWGEGVGVLVLERLSDAQRNGHPVLALVRGSALNHDGASNGLTAPNGPAQERVIRTALARAGLGPGDVDVVEGHGTGTPLGDPIEAGALLATYGQKRKNGPLLLGSVKSNIGHPQAAAGVAGVIKIVEAMAHEHLPATLHVDAPSGQVNWETGAVELLSKPRTWSRNGRPRRAGVSSFGISGTNAHVILEEPPAQDDGEHTVVQEPGERDGAPPPLDGTVALALSAKSEPALREAAARLAARIEDDPGLDPADVGLSLVSTRALFDQRAVVHGRDRGELLAGLGALAAGERARNVAIGRAQRGKLAFLFTGQGAQHAGMGAGLYEDSPPFAAALDEVCAEFDKHLDRPLAEVVLARRVDAGALLERTDVTQPGLFALEVALYRLLESFDVRPQLVVGHSIGELAAAHLAGVFSLEHACELVAARARLMGALPPGGAMLTLEASEIEAGQAINDLQDVSIAAVNAPRAVVVSGPSQTLDELEARFEHGRTRRLRVSHAFHSPLMDPMLEQFEAIAAQIDYSDPKIPIISTVTGEPLTPEQARDPHYWVTQARNAVRFGDAISTAAEHGARTIIELGPDAVLCAAAAATLPDDLQVTIAPTLRPKRPEHETLTIALARVHTTTAAVDWATLYPTARAVDLPTYAFQRERFWLEGGVGVGDLSRVGLEAAEHPLLGAVVELPDGEGWVFSGRLSLESFPWLADHGVFDSVLLPGTAFVELAVCAGGRAGLERVEELTLHVPLVLAEEGGVLVQVVVGRLDEHGGRPVSISSRPDRDGGEWACHATGSVAAAVGGDAGEGIELSQWPPADAQPLESADGVYARLGQRGFAYGPAFQGLGRAWRRGEEVFAEITLEQARLEEAGGYAIHPALLDACFHPVIEAFAAEMPDGRVPLPFSFGGVRVLRSGAGALRVVIARTGAETLRLCAFDAAGEAVITIDSLLTLPIDQAQLAGARRGASGSLFVLDWDELGALGEGSGEPLRLACLGEFENEQIEDRFADLGVLVEALERGAEPPAVVLAPVACLDSDQVEEAAHSAAQLTLRLLQQWLAEPRLADTRLVILTRRAVAIDAGDDPDLAHAAVWGLLRSAQTEHPGRFTLLDLHERSDVPWRALLATGEQQLAWRGDHARTPKLTPLPAKSDTLSEPQTGQWRLCSEGGATLEDLVLADSPQAAAPLQPRDVRVAVHAAGLNFRDLMVTLGLYPGEAPVGSEGTGVVLEVGSGVEELAPGDRVMGLIADSFGPLAVTDSRLLTKIPADWSYATAAAIPLVFLTAYYALVDLANLKAHERILIHSAAGGVGLAAVELAQHIGAEVFATASPPKWDLLINRGIDRAHLASSRELNFRERFLERTADAGMDVVLDALVREFVDASLELLPRGGRFIEMGKVDVRDAGRVAEEHPGVDYRAFNLLDAGAARIQEMLAELMRLFETGALRLPPIRCFDVREAPRALRCLREARHVGKLVLTIPQPLDDDATVLITGGTGGLGARLARHLIERHRARHLLLASRRGPEGEGAAELAAELERSGASVRVVACDVRDRDAVSALLDSVARERPLRMVIHAAGVIEDATLEALAPEQLERVMRTKVDAAVHLDALTSDLELCELVLFSSAAGTLGSPGQANYAAANAVLDALAHKRRTRGLRARSLAWGPWETSGGMADALDRGDLSRLGRAGIEPLPAAHALQLFDAATRSAPAQLIPLGVSQEALRGGTDTGALHPLLRSLGERKPADDAGGGQLLRRLADVSTKERSGLILAEVCGQIAAVLGFASAEEIDPAIAIEELDFDSLDGVELRNRIAHSSGIRLPPNVAHTHPTPVELAQFLAAQLNGASGGHVREAALEGHDASATHQPAG